MEDGAVREAWERREIACRKALVFKSLAEEAVKDWRKAEDEFYRLVALFCEEIKKGR